MGSLLIKLFVFVDCSSQNNGYWQKSTSRISTIIMLIRIMKKTDEHGKTSAQTEIDNNHSTISFVPLLTRSFLNVIIFSIFLSFLFLFTVVYFLCYNFCLAVAHSIIQPIKRFSDVACRSELCLYPPPFFLFYCRHSLSLPFSNFLFHYVRSSCSKSICINTTRSMESNSYSSK